MGLWWGYGAEDKVGFAKIGQHNIYKIQQMRIQWLSWWLQHPLLWLNQQTWGSNGCIIMVNKGRSDIDKDYIKMIKDGSSNG